MFAPPCQRDRRQPRLPPEAPLIAAAGVNAAAYHAGIFRTVAIWNRDATSPIAARTAALLSLALWTGVPSCSRLPANF